MIVCFKCTAETKEQLDLLLQSGSYPDYAEAIASAVRTQLLIEQEVADMDAVLIGDAQTSRAESHFKGRWRRANFEARPTVSTPKQIPALFRLDGFPFEPPDGLAEVAPVVPVQGQDTALDGWILGQYNRLLPIKANARALVRLYRENPKALAIDSVGVAIAHQAAILGDFLRGLDAKAGAGRDDSLATAFPTRGKDSAKSCRRYANQFVVHQNSKGELCGLMADMKLLSVTRQGGDQLAVPNPVAWEFASLTSPVLDGVGEGPRDKLSQEERGLLLRHIISSVPVEAFAYRAILEAVGHGHNTPESIDLALGASLAPKRAEMLSASFLASQRSGAVSRMADLGLMERVRKGVRVTYAATEAGQAFLGMAASAK
jgi:hypothetical protein